MEIDRSLKLYRYMSFKRFCQILFEKELVFVHPDLWSDQYETSLVRSLASNKHKRIPNEFLIDSKLSPEEAYQMFVETVECVTSEIRCLCFSRSKDAEVMWNAYNFQNETIMIRTSLQKVLSIAPDEFGCIRVLYDQNGSLLGSLLKEHCCFSDSGLTIVDADEVFRHKRKCFQYENEFRILASTFNTEIGRVEGKLLKYSIPSIPDFIEKVMVHPLASDDYVALIRKMCKHFNVDFWGRSKVYEFKEK